MLMAHLTHQISPRNAPKLTINRIDRIYCSTAVTPGERDRVIVKPVKEQSNFPHRPHLRSVIHSEPAAARLGPRLPLSSSFALES
jgi:hypothetical protein